MIEVVFSNGLSSDTYNRSSNFTVSINIVNSPDIGYYDIGIQWNPSVFMLKDNNTSTDVIEGGFMKAFGSTLFPGPSASGTNLTAGYMSDIPDGYISGGPAHGNGTLFTILFRTRTTSPTTTISIMSPNTVSYLLAENLTSLVKINAVVNGTVTVVPEFPASALLPLFLVVTTIAVATATVASRKRRILPRISQHE
jgi:hypothetical protein